jgi:hypothetical protein
VLTATAGGGLADRPRIAVTDALTGALLTLADLPELRRAGSCGAPGCRRRPETCEPDLTGRPGLGAPPATDGYRPAARPDRSTRARDRHCRFPGCRRRIPRAGELDHLRPWPAGPTAAADLAGFCTANHRGKQQAPGWSYTLAPDGTLTVTTPPASPRSPTHPRTDPTTTPGRTCGHGEPRPGRGRGSPWTDQPEPGSAARARLRRCGWRRGPGRPGSPGCG